MATSSSSSSSISSLSSSSTKKSTTVNVTETVSYCQLPLEEDTTIPSPFMFEEQHNIITMSETDKGPIIEKEEASTTYQVQVEDDSLNHDDDEIKEDASDNMFSRVEKPDDIHHHCSYQEHTKQDFTATIDNALREIDRYETDDVVEPDRDIDDDMEASVVSTPHSLTSYASFHSESSISHSSTSCDSRTMAIAMDSSVCIVTPTEVIETNPMANQYQYCHSWKSQPNQNCKLPIRPTVVTPNYASFRKEDDTANTTSSFVPEDDDDSASVGFKTFKTMEEAKQRSSKNHNGQRRLALWWRYGLVLVMICIVLAVTLSVLFVKTTPSIFKGRVASGSFEVLQSDQDVNVTTTAEEEQSTHSCWMHRKLQNRNQLELELHWRGMTRTVHPIEQRQMELAMAVAFNQASGGRNGCQDSKWKRWMYNATLLQQTVKQDLVLFHPHPDEHLPAKNSTSSSSLLPPHPLDNVLVDTLVLVTRFDTYISCNNCVVQEAFASVYPAYFDKNEDMEEKHNDRSLKDEQQKRSHGLIRKHHRAERRLDKAQQEEHKFILNAGHVIQSIERAMRTILADFQGFEQVTINIPTTTTEKFNENDGDKGGNATHTPTSTITMQRLDSSSSIAASRITETGHDQEGDDIDDELLYRPIIARNPMFSRMKNILLDCATVVHSGRKKRWRKSDKSYKSDKHYNYHDQKSDKSDKSTKYDYEGQSYQSDKSTKYDNKNDKPDKSTKDDDKNDKSDKSTKDDDKNNDKSDKSTKDDDKKNDKSDKNTKDDKKSDKSDKSTKSDKSDKSTKSDNASSGDDDDNDISDHGSSDEKNDVGDDDDKQGESHSDLHGSSDDDNNDKGEGSDHGHTDNDGDDDNSEHLANDGADDDDDGGENHSSLEHRPSDDDDGEDDVSDDDNNEDGESYSSSSNEPSGGDDDDNDDDESHSDSDHKPNDGNGDEDDDKDESNNEDNVETVLVDNEGSVDHQSSEGDDHDDDDGDVDKETESDEVAVEEDKETASDHNDDENDSGEFDDGPEDANSESDDKEDSRNEVVQLPTVGPSSNYGAIDDEVDTTMEPSTSPDWEIDVGDEENLIANDSHFDWDSCYDYHEEDEADEDVILDGNSSDQLLTRNPPCSVCGEERTVTIYDAIFRPKERSPTTCGLLQIAGAMGRLPADYCSVLPDVIIHRCGCQPIPSASETWK